MGSVPGVSAVFQGRDGPPLHAKGVLGSPEDVCLEQCKSITPNDHIHV